MNILLNIIRFWTGKQIVDQSPVLKEVRKDINKALLAILAVIGIQVITFSVLPRDYKEITFPLVALVLCGINLVKSKRKGQKDMFILFALLSVMWAVMIFRYIMR